MYKVNVKILGDLKKQLLANNKFLNSLSANQSASAERVKLIKANEKQIKLLEDEFYIN